MDHIIFYTLNGSRTFTNVSHETFEIIDFFGVYEQNAQNNNRRINRCATMAIHHLSIHI